MSRTLLFVNDTVVCQFVEGTTPIVLLLYVILVHYLFVANIVVGSFQGYIRIYEPHPPGYSASHVMLEKELGVPVIQITLGKFLT